MRIRLFRTLWLATLVSNIGSWMQTVGAQWLVVHSAHAAILVSLVQTAYTLPAVLFALVGGVLADLFDRVKLLVAVLAGMTATAAALTALTAVHRMPPALLLMFTFVLGTGAILVAPAYQSLVPDMVPREQVPVAAADRRHRLGPLPGRREPARVYRAVQRGELGRAPQAAPERQTGTDLELHDAAAALSDPPPQTDHYLAAAVRE